MANFDTSNNHNAKIRYLDTGDFLVVEWKDVYLQVYSLLFYHYGILQIRKDSCHGHGTYIKQKISYHLYLFKGIRILKTNASDWDPNWIHIEKSKNYGTQ
jgi:hypothetical protein